MSLHGGGSVGAWQRAYFPAFQYKERYRLVIATPSSATKEPVRRWVGEADDAHLRNIVANVFDRYGKNNIASFWLIGHSQGGMTANRLLSDDFFKDRVDGWFEPLWRADRADRASGVFLRPLARSAALDVGPRSGHTPPRPRLAA